MKNIIITLMFVCVPLSVSVPAKWYSRKLQLQQDSLKLADSLRVIDSIRIADSTRFADSCMLARYHQSDVLLAAEKKRKTALLTQEVTATPVSIEAIRESEVDNFTARSINIDPANPAARKIDSLQTKIDSLENRVYGENGIFRKMRTYALSEKKRYMLFLMEHRMSDTSSILVCCNLLFAAYNTRLTLLNAIAETQDANTKSFMQYHIEEHRKKLAELSSFIREFTPEMPFYPERNLPAAIMEW